MYKEQDDYENVKNAVRVRITFEELDENRNVVNTHTSEGRYGIIFTFGSEKIDVVTCGYTCTDDIENMIEYLSNDMRKMLEGDD